MRFKQRCKPQWSRLSFWIVGATIAVFSYQPPRQLSAQEPSEAERLTAMILTSKAFRAAAAKIQPALVTIESFGGVSAVQGKIGGIRQQGEGNTTGVMISPDGYIITSICYRKGKECNICIIRSCHSAFICYGNRIIC